MIKSLPELTWGLEISLCDELLPSSGSDIKLRPDVKDSVLLGAAARSWERDEKEGVGEGNLTAPSPAIASLSLDKLETSWLVSGFRAEGPSELFSLAVTPSPSPLYFQPASI